MTKTKTILVSNDDGYNSEGIVALAQALSPLGRVIVVAPSTNQSAMSHSITLRRPLRLTKHSSQVQHGNSLEIYSVDGTPSDAVYLAVNFLLKNEKIDLICSGINHGGNLGKDVVYSGTVSAAREGVFFGIPSVAVSLVANHSFDFTEAAAFAGSFCANLLEQELPKDLLFNINVPKIVSQSEYAITTVGEHDYSLDVEQRIDPRGEPYYWVGGEWSGYRDLPGTDCKAIADGYISVTPISLRLTNEPLLPWLSAHSVPGHSANDLYKLPTATVR